MGKHWILDDVGITFRHANGSDIFRNITVHINIIHYLIQVHKKNRSQRSKMDEHIALCWHLLLQNRMIKILFEALEEHTLMCTQERNN